MINTIIGKKIGMTQVYDDNNVLVPVTVVEAGPCPVVQVKTVDTDGYNAVQLGYSAKKAKNTSKAETNHAKKAGLELAPRIIDEVRLAEAPEVKAGDTVTVEAFTVGQLIDVTGVSKGKGFAGVVKRFRVAGGPATHGSMFHRRIGSVGMRQTPGRVFKNQKMPGQMGNKRRTVQNLRIVLVDAAKNLLLVRGAIPGANGETVVVRSAVKGQKKAAA
ncbi:50S ribosomal protein L3 [Synoicihabitans lomoniglobus]|uniref:Large ribosomal subunit protein uL3 n=1 Tax=Synoicihabitans lomoniglobus TaxID=2909285 RepID=A0AAF0A219_9BACT|nr:50S ribosomal protein L3 [Opitutaceae bacterium LMO-M01]WED65617.1 50S ribosomal protein L3 [Opitutaceae bacterium LMO-M01]